MEMRDCDGVLRGERCCFPGNSNEHRVGGYRWIWLIACVVAGKMGVRMLEYMCTLGCVDYEWLSTMRTRLSD